MKIRAVDGLEVIDSRGNPTVEARVHLEDGTVAEARVPSVNQISSSRRCRPSATSTGAPSAAGASALSDATSARLTMRAWWKYVLISVST